MNCRATLCTLCTPCSLWCLVRNGMSVWVQKSCQIMWDKPWLNLFLPWRELIFFFLSWELPGWMKTCMTQPYLNILVSLVSEKWVSWPRQSLCSFGCGSQVPITAFHLSRSFSWCVTQAQYKTLFLLYQDQPVLMCFECCFIWGNLSWKKKAGLNLMHEYSAVC